MGFEYIFPKSSSDVHAQILLDGGLGTTLEDYFHKDISHPLWSARLVDKDEDTIVAAHLAFLRAGSQVILTSTYQTGYETFRRAGYADADAERLMRKSVQLAADARRVYEAELRTAEDSQTKGKQAPKTKIALALGPYGATLETAAEFTGMYPPPYGPLSSSPNPRRRIVPESEEDCYQDALASFHLTRLLVFARVAHIWDMIDLIAFETVPLITEANAIRRAVAKLEEWFHETDTGPENSPKSKDWYISFVFPGEHGEFPQDSPASSEQAWESTENTTSIGCRSYTPYEVAQAAFLPGVQGQQKMAIPNGIGVNCTKGHFISKVLDGYVLAVKDFQLKDQNHFLDDERPWIALYPNGGLSYDPVGHAWIASSQEIEVSEGEGWAASLVESLHMKTSVHLPHWSSVFGGLLVGGCCKTGPNEIQALKRLLPDRG